MNVEKKLDETILKMYKKNKEYKVRVGEKLNRKLDTTLGLRLVCPLNSMLFVLYISNVDENWKNV